LGVTTRPTPTALAAAGRAISKRRETLVAGWANWIDGRQASIGTVSNEIIQRQLGLLVDVLGELDGPLRHDANDLWHIASEWYGKNAADRGLATGEIVEEFQHFRELLFRELSDVVAALPARALIDTVMRLNRWLDRGIAHAVVGYTDSLVETLLDRRGVPVSTRDVAEAELEKQLDQLERELEEIREQGRAVGGDSVS
jgi:hypothetical protein